MSSQCREKLADYLEQGPAAPGWDQSQVWTEAGAVTLIGRKSHGLRRLDLLRGRGGVHTQVADRTYLGTARHHPGREGERPRLRAGPGRRADRDAAGLADPAAPSAATPHRTQGRAPQLVRARLITLVDGVHQLVQAPIVLVWVRLNTFVSDEMRDLIDARA
ncbi:hypothetical protein AB0D37_38990 [Streptomyces sp. NPDC048384]|uniref:hypothetical protein n=1 Tax=Streptomyces sp. NPDC048384 TaxID=3155487 RepID=UPI0034290F52